MACGHGKLWWKGAGRLGMREGCREARDRARAAPRARASQPPEAEVLRKAFGRSQVAGIRLS